MAIFIAALFVIAKKWDDPGCPSTDDWVKKRWYIDTVEFYSDAKRNKSMTFARK